MRIAVTQRVYFDPDRQERSDTLDQRWIALLQSCGLDPIVIPNSLENPENLMDELGLGGLLLTGGNDFSVEFLNSLRQPVETPTPQMARERDLTEQTLVFEAMRRRLPILGVCRGMQMLHLLAGGTLTRVTGHVRIRHSLTLHPNGVKIRFPDQVNSFHGFGIPADMLKRDYQLLASVDGIAEAFASSVAPIWGIMWHPEREPEFHPSDLRLVRRIFSDHTLEPGDRNA